MDKDFLSRSVNMGFSGGEKKRNEILQMLTLQPRLAVLDETDSGLDVDALKIVAKGDQHFAQPGAIDDSGNALRATASSSSSPDYVHVLAGGRILKTGDKTLARELDERGYDWVQQEATTA